MVRDLSRRAGGGGPATPAARPGDVTPVTVPDFDAERGLQWSSTRAEYDQARKDERYVFEQFTYQSDGLTVGAYLYRPRERSAAARPVIVFNRGSYVRPTDEDMPIDQSERMAAALARLGRTHRYVPFDGEQHRIGGRGAERDAETIAWFRRFGG